MNTMMKTIKIFDTTLRDGEQSPGAAMTQEEKVAIAHTLDEMGVDIIEAGFPFANPADFEAVKAISAVVKNATVCGLARAMKKDIEAAGKATSGAAQSRIHTFISTSPVHMKHKLKMEADDVLDAVSESVSYARQFTDDVEWSAEDATRTETDFLCRTVEAAIKAGATTINIPDTVGYITPIEYAAIFKTLIEKVPGADEVVFSTHCHDDLGMAVANSLAGVQASAGQIECTINGIGERAGNASLEEIVMAIRTRADVMQVQTNIKTENITRASRQVSSITGFAVPPNKAIVGSNAFAHESGIHQDGMLKNRETYEIMTPEDVGWAQTHLVMGKLSGRNALRSKLEELGYTIAGEQLDKAFAEFKELSGKKKKIYDEDLMAIVDTRLEEGKEAFVLQNMHVNWNDKGDMKNVTVTMRINGEEKVVEATGDGPINAIMVAAKEAANMEEAVLTHFKVDAITEGSDAQAGVTVRVRMGERTYSGRSHNTNTLMATALAYVAALNKAHILSNQSQAAA